MVALGDIVNTKLMVRPDSSWLFQLELMQKRKPLVNEEQHYHDITNT